jgi:hypothetical protein
MSSSLHSEEKPVDLHLNYAAKDRDVESEYVALSPAEEKKLIRKIDYKVRRRRVRLVEAELTFSFFFPFPTDVSSSFPSFPSSTFSRFSTVSTLDKHVLMGSRRT